MFRFHFHFNDNEVIRPGSVVQKSLEEHQQTVKEISDASTNDTNEVSNRNVTKSLSAPLNTIENGQRRKPTNDVITKFNKISDKYDDYKDNSIYNDDVDDNGTYDKDVIIDNKTSSKHQNLTEYEVLLTNNGKFIYLTFIQTVSCKCTLNFV